MIHSFLASIPIAIRTWQKHGLGRASVAWLVMSTHNDYIAKKKRGKKRVHRAFCPLVH